MAAMDRTKAKRKASTRPFRPRVAFGYSPSLSNEYGRFKAERLGCFQVALAPKKRNWRRSVRTI